MRKSGWTAAATFGAIVACGHDGPPANPPLPVTVVTVGGSTAGIGETRYSGAIKADESVDVAFRLSGIVEEITQVRGADGRIRDLQDGDIVRRGEVLARLRQNEFQDQVSDAEASLRQAQADYERASQLYENRSVSKAEYDAAYARYTAGRAKQSQAAISLSDATLRAPLDGVIIRRTVEVGSLAGPSAPAFTVADTRVVKVVFGVPDVVVAGLKPGGKLTIQAEAMPGATLEARIVRISPSADPSSRVFEVEAALPNPEGRLKVGMLATLRLGEAAPTASSVRAARGGHPARRRFRRLRGVRAPRLRPQGGGTAAARATGRCKRKSHRGSRGAQLPAHASSYEEPRSWPMGKRFR